VIPVSENGEILYRDRFLFLPDKQFLRNFLPFFNSLGGDKKPLVFQGLYKQRFLQNVLPKLHGTMDILVPEELKERYISPDLNIELYFDKYQNYVKVELFFKYDEYRFNSFENLNSGDYIILRQREKEMAVINQLEELGFEPYSGFYLLKADSEIYHFIREGLTALMEYGEVFYSEAFRKMKAKQNNSFSVGLRVSKDIDLMELDLVSGECEFYKSGAAPSYVYRNGGLFKLRSCTMPIGILDEADTKSVKFDLSAGDVVVMMSDGVTCGEDECAWLFELLLQNVGRAPLERIADLILKYAVGHGSDDDISVAVIRVEERGE
jgi:hypothetical protein